VKLQRIKSYLNKESTSKKSGFKITSISLRFRVEASKKIIIVNRDRKITYHVNKSTGRCVKDVLLILPVMCDRTQKSACNIIREAAFVFPIREGYSRQENLVEPDWELLMNTAEIISATLFRRLLELAKLVNKGLT